MTKPGGSKSRKLLQFSIGEIRLRLYIREKLLDAPFGLFCTFRPVTPAVPASDFFLDVLEEDRFTPPADPDFDLATARVDGNGNTITIRAPFFESVLNFATKSGTCRQSPRSPGYRACVQVILATLAAPRGTIFLHGAGLADGGAGYLFCGPSGAGKSTVAELSGRPVLNDELCAVRVRLPGGPAVAGTPLGLCATAGELPLRKIFWLEQSPEDAVEQLHPSAALALILAQTVSGANDPAHINLLFQLVAELVERVPVYRLRFTRSRKFLRWLDGTPGNNE